MNRDAHNAGSTSRTTRRGGCRTCRLSSRRSRRAASDRRSDRGVRGRTAVARCDAAGRSARRGGTGHRATVAGRNAPPADTGNSASAIITAAITAAALVERIERRCAPSRPYRVARVERGPDPRCPAVDRWRASTRSLRAWSTCHAGYRSASLACCCCGSVRQLSGDSLRHGECVPRSVASADGETDNHHRRRNGGRGRARRRRPGVLPIADSRGAGATAVGGV